MRARTQEPRFVVVAGVLVAVGLSIRNGEFNLVFYLFRGIHAGDPTALRNDWYTEDTAPFHIVWNHLVGWAVGHGVLDTMLTIGALICGVGVAAGLYLVTKALYDRPLLPWLAALVLLVSCSALARRLYLLPPTSSRSGSPARHSCAPSLPWPGASRCLPGWPSGCTRSGTCNWGA